MSIRRIFLVLVAPLFILLAAVNGGLLYVWEKAEAEKGLEAEAIAAAVTVAAFLSTPERARAVLANPIRSGALEEAVTRSPGLQGVWILEPGRPALRLAGQGTADEPHSVQAPALPRATAMRRDRGGPHVLGLAAAGEGRTVVARIDAAPLFERVSGLQRLIAVLVAATGAVGLVLALMVARMIRRELARNSAQVASMGDDGPPPHEGGFRIRETRDLSAAVRLMRTSVAGRVARGRRELLRRDRGRTPASSVTALRPSLSPPISADGAAGRVAARLVGNPGPGVFVAFAQRDGRAGVVLAEAVADSPPAALALALAARRALEAPTILDGDPAGRIDDARMAFSLCRVVWRVWSTDELAGLEVIGLADDPAALARARSYAERAGGLAPQEVLDDLEALLDIDGAIAVIAPSMPA